MIATQLILISFIITTNALSIGTVSEQNVTKREANLGDLFPDWVPFKNKHGEELGEFVQVARKPKKRLAPPVNFVLRAVADSENDDYFEKGQGEGDSDDYYEKKDWSDINRSAPSHDPSKALNHTEISEIDGVVNIITKKPTNPVVEALQKAKQKGISELKEKEENKSFEIRDSVEETKTPSGKKKARNYEDDIDYEESNTEKRKLESIEEDQNDNYAKKAILDTVDELKLRHAKEQVAIAEKDKEEEIYKEELERQKIQAQLSPVENDKYDDRYRPVAKKKYPDYDEYEEKYVSLDEKYKVSPERTKPTTTRLPKRTSKVKEKKDKKIETGKLSVFKNPQLYIVYDDDSEETTTIKPKPKQSNKGKSYKPERFSAKYSGTPGLIDVAESNERISLVPDESEGKEGEPTLFFPKRRKNKKRKKPAPVLPDTTSVATTEQDTKPVNITTKAPVFDNVSNETTASDNTSAEVTGSDTTGSDSKIIDTTVQTGPSGTDAVSTNTDAVTDAIPASTHHHKEPEKKEENYHREKGKSFNLNCLLLI
ncbi:hypothetical protein HF086_000058 [Spodoptera exigua]|uniref:Uncharacterized protein n=1 Tax=Spodoptera exigua TaxID=7107 RepID=A0A922MX36_SPOEX|nr:hypothetical protein HF086_000058 [Spodoptera exigua]